jgi:hypothetical protein
VAKLRTTIRERNVTRIGEIRSPYKTSVWNPEGRRRLCIGICGRIILKLILRKVDIRIWRGFKCFASRPNDGAFVNKVMNLRLPKKSLTNWIGVTIDFWRKIQILRFHGDYCSCHTGTTREILRPSTFSYSLTRLHGVIIHKTKILQKYSAYWR